MGKKEKAMLLQAIVYECYCDMSLFTENVLNSSGGAKVFADKFAKAESREDLENLVNEYI